MLFHSFGAEAGQPVWTPLQPVRAVADLGWLGVHVFFVLSGYCMAEKISSLATAGRGAGRFLIDRAWRIYPAYWAALLVTVSLGVVSAPFNSSGIKGAFPSSIGAGVAETLLVQTYIGSGAILLVGWTLVCETGFYAITTLFLASWRALRGLAGVVFVGGVLAVASRFTPTGDAWLVPRL
jgi:exopolysaccharide production protein ExoZ